MIDVKRIAAAHWQEYTELDLKVLEDVAIEATKQAAEIAKKFDFEAAWAILQSGVNQSRED